MAPFVEEPAEESRAFSSKVAPNLVAPEPGMRPQSRSRIHPLTSPQSTAQVLNPRKLVKAMHAPAVPINKYALPRPKAPTPIFQSSQSDSPR